MQDFKLNLTTKIHFGKGCTREIGAVAKQYSDVALIVYGGGSIKKNGAYDDVTSSLKESGVRYVELSGVKPNPRIESVDEGVKISRENGVGVIIPIGGGSTIDCAKGIAAAIAYEGPAWDIVLDGSKVTTCLPILTVPTIAASGSETDAGAMLINEKTHDKAQIFNPKLCPKDTFMDPTYTMSLPKKQTAAGAADIMSHIFEIYFSKTEGAYMSDRVMEAILKTVVKYGKIAVDEPDNYEARANLMWASSWAINGFVGCGKIGRRWSCHPIEHQLGAYYDETHGIGLAILTPVWMKYILNDDTVDMFANYGKYVFEIDPSLDDYAIANRAISCTEDLFASWGIPKKLHESGIGLEDESLFEEMAEKALGPAGVINAYVPLNKEDVINIYRGAF